MPASRSLVLGRSVAALAVMLLLVGLAPPAEAGSAPPPPRGYFRLKPVGAWSTLPSGRTCKRLVHYSTWEPRPENTEENRATQSSTAIRASFSARPRYDGRGTYDQKWDTWLLPRVRGNFSGTTDEIFQWAACKWGLPDNLIRAAAVRESTWYQRLTYPNGRCVTHRGCGDFFSSPSEASKVYCDGLAQYGRDYQEDYGSGLCPKTFSILGIMSWFDPEWDYTYPGYQNGTFPFNRNSTAFAADYYAAHIRGCYEGWEYWLKNTGTETYAAGDLWGCVGSWYSGDWHSDAANGYTSRVKAEWSNHTWLKAVFAEKHYGCDETYGCPR